MQKVARSKKAPMKAAVDRATVKLYKSHKTSAKNRNIPFNISKAELGKLLKQECVYCSKKDSNTILINKHSFHYNDIDLWDPSIGYESGNVVSCCNRCNFLKNKSLPRLNGNDFLEWINSVTNTARSLPDIKLQKLNYYHERAIAAAKGSHDAETKVGAILISKSTGAVISEGYNGFIRGATDDKLPNTRPEKYNYTVHAETNLICNAVRNGVKTSDCVIYCTLSPCTKCLRMLWQAGIEEFYFKDKYRDFEQCTNMLDLEIALTEVESFYRMIVKPRKL